MKLLAIMYYKTSILGEFLRGLVQSPCGKINVIMTLIVYPPPSPLLTSQHFGQDSTLKSLRV